MHARAFRKLNEIWGLGPIKEKDASYQVLLHSRGINKYLEATRREH